MSSEYWIQRMLDNAFDANAFSWSLGIDSGHPRREFRETCVCIILVNSPRSYFFCFFFFLVSCIARSGVRGVLEMIVCRRAPSSLDMSPCRTIWTHSKQNSITFIKTLGPGAGTCARDLGLGRAGSGGRVCMLVELKLVTVCGVASGIRGFVVNSWLHG